jgi:hypothetical protein
MKEQHNYMYMNAGALALLNMFAYLLENDCYLDLGVVKLMELYQSLII